MWKNSSFAFRLNVIICLLSLLSALSIILITSFFSRRALENEIRERGIPGIADTLESAMRRSLDLSEKSLLFLSRHPVLHAWVENGAKEAEFAPVAALCRDFAASFGVDRVNISLTASRDYYEGADGVLQVKKLDPEVDAWFDRFIQSGRISESNVHPPSDPVYGGITFVNVRIEDDKGRALGAVGAPLNLSGPGDVAFAREQKLGREGSAFVVSGRGVVLVHSDPSLVNSRLSDLPGFSDVAMPPPEEETFFTLRLSGGGGLLVGTKPLPSMGATIFVTADEREVFRDINKALYYSLAAGYLVFCLTLAVGFYASRVVTRSISRVVDFADRMDSGKAVEPFTCEGSADLRRLGAALNTMNDRLRESSLSLESVKGLFDGLETALLVTDPETDEILYANRRMLEEFEVRENPVGRRCWETFLPHAEERCLVCPQDSLRDDPEAVVRREERHPGNGRLYEAISRRIDWAGGRKAHLIQRLDITEAHEARELMSQRIAHQRLLIAISQSFFSTEAVDSLIASVTAMIGEFSALSRVRLSRYSEARGVVICEYEWLHPEHGARPMLGVEARIQRDRTFHNRFLELKETYAAVPDVAADPELLTLPDFGVKAFMDVPIFVDGRLWGLLGVDDCTGPREWDDSHIRLFRLIGGMLSGMLFRRKAEEKLLRMSSLTEEATQYIAYINRRGEFQYFNSSTCELLGYSTGELFEKGLKCFFDHETLAYVHKTIIPAIISEKRLSFELPLIRKDGERRIFAFESFCIGSGEDLGIGVIGLDITDKKALERELVFAKEASEQASRAKSEFLSRMSHEMRTPLNAITGMALVAQAAREEDKRRECLEKISAAAAHLLEVINEILDMSSIEASTFLLKPAEFVFRQILGNVVNRHRGPAEQKKLNLSLSVDPAIPHVLVADGGRLAQVFTNLLSNALKFTPERGSVTVSARLLDERDGVCTLECRVADSGIGISSEQTDRVFAPFEQADGSLSRKFEGAGLGLAISRSIVEMMGGDIRIDSGPGGGTNVTFTVRARRADPGVSMAESAFGRFTRESVQVARAEGEGKKNEYPATGAWETSPAHAFWVETLAPEGEFSLAFAREKPRAEDLHGRIGQEQLGGQKTQADPGEEDAPEQRPGMFAGYRLLLAEDIEINREIVMALLEGTGIVVDCARNGREAVNMVLADPSRYHLIFMDINMPELNGYEAARKIRSSGDEGLADIPIIAMTASAFPEDIARCLEAGMDDHLAKPIMPDKLIRLMRVYLPEERRDVALLTEYADGRGANMGRK